MQPTDLPEGEVVELMPVDEVLASGGGYLVVSKLRARATGR